MSIRLTIDDAYRPALAAAGLDSFDALMHADVGEVVTRRKGRETRRVELPTGDGVCVMYLKRVFSIGPKHSFWPRFVGRPCHTPAIKEFDAIQILTKAGVPTARPIACGESRRFGFPRCGFIATEAAPSRWTLNHWLTEGYERPRALENKERAGLLRAVGELFSKFTRAGIDWPDMNAKHILAEPVGSGSWRLCVIDLERARRMPDGSRSGEPFLGGKTDWSVFTSLSPSALRYEEVTAFWAGALTDSAATFEGVPLIDFISSLSMVRFGREANPTLPEDWEHPNTLPMVIHNGMRVDPRYVEALRRAGLDTYDKVMALSDGASLDKPGLSSHRERIRLALDVDGEPRTVYLKRYKRPPLREQLRRMWEFRLARGSAEREMHYIRHLGLLGIPTMTRVAFGSRMRGWIEESGFGMTAEVPGESLEKLVERWFEVATSPASKQGGRYPAPSPARRREIIDQLARIAFRMHDNGLFHRDFYLCHIFMSHCKDGRVVLSVIDLARMIRSNNRRKRWSIKDLAALNHSAPSPFVTRADRLRFLYDYLRRGSIGDDASLRKQVRHMTALISRRTRRMARHDAARERRTEQG